MAASSPPIGYPWPPEVCVLIPAYKSGTLLAEFLPHLLEVVPAGAVWIVDDGSEDDTAEVCRGRGVQCLINDVNRGKGAVLRQGFAYLVDQGARWILTMDADGQHAVEDIPGFISEMRRYPDAGMIVGARCMLPGKMPFARILSNRLTSAVLTLLTGKKILDSQSGYRLYSRELLQAVTLEYPRFEMESEVILKACRSGFEIRFVDVQTLYFNTRSHISHCADTLRWIVAVSRVWWNLRRTSMVGKARENGR